MIITHEDLIYSAYSRCLCGAGLAHLVDVTIGTQYWDCSKIWLSEAEMETKHVERMPFAFYNVKSEQQTSANGATTRPISAPAARKPTPKVFDVQDEKLEVLLKLLFEEAKHLVHTGSVNGQDVKILVTHATPARLVTTDKNPIWATWWLREDGTIQYVHDTIVASSAMDFQGNKFVIHVDEKEK